MTPPHEKYLSQPDELPLVDLLRRSSIYLAGVEKELAEKTDKLEAAGLVERRPNVADRRKICLHPTADGTAEHERIQGQLAEVVEAAVSSLDSADREGSRTGLRTLAAQ